MMRLGWMVVCASAGLGFGSENKPATGIGAKVSTFKLRDYRGAERSLDEFASNKAVVLAFVSCDCPIAKQYGPRLASLAKEFESKGVAFIGIDPNQQDGPTDIARYAQQAGVNFPVLKDVNNVLADRLGVQRTTEAFVLDSERVIRYRGRIDDQYNIGISRPQAKRNDLAEALTEVLAGKPVSQPTTPALGCLVGRVHKPVANGSVTYTKDIASILNHHCVECHRPGEIRPFSLTSYDEVIGWADMIDEVVRQRRMPPWHADPKYGHFANDSRLSDTEKKLILDWVEAGTPQGDPKDLPKPPVYAAGWRNSQARCDLQDSQALQGSGSRNCPISVLHHRYGIHRRKMGKGCRSEAELPVGSPPRARLRAAARQRQVAARP